MIVTGGMGSVSISKPRVALKVGRKLIQFMVDTVAESSVFLTWNDPLAERQTWVQGATGTKPY